MGFGLNRFNRLALVVGLCLGLLSCNKKNRLTDSTYNFSISPPAATVVKNQSITLTARGTSTNGSINVNPTWTVSSPTLGNLSTSIGPSVVFQSQNLGDVVVSANFDGLTATSQIAIVTYQPGSNTFDVYDDDLPLEAGITADIFASTFPLSIAMPLSESSSGYTPEGLKYQHATSAPEGSFWGVTLDATDIGQNKSLVAFNGGNLKFALRLGRTVANDETIRIELTDSTPPGIGVNLVSGSNGFNRLGTDWQEITIPIASFGGLDTSAIEVPFAVVMLDLNGGTLTFDIDAVRWEN